MGFFDDFLDGETEDHVEVPWQEIDFKKFSVLASCASFTEFSLSYPFEVVKTKQQVARALHSPSMMTVSKGILNDAGPTGFFRGFPYLVAGGLPADLIYYYCYNEMKYQLGHTVFGSTHDTMVHMASGAFADLACNTIMTPFDVLAIRLQVQDFSQAHSNPGGIHIAKQILRTEGIKGLYRGYAASVGVYGPFSAIWWATYEKSKVYVINKNNKRDQDKKLPALLLCGMSGAMAGITAASVTNPLDVVKTRYQAATVRLSLGETFRNIISESGLFGLYKGLGPRVLATTPRSGISLMMYELVMKNSRTTRIEEELDI